MPEILNYPILNIKLPDIDELNLGNPTVSGFSSFFNNYISLENEVVLNNKACVNINTTVCG